VSGRFIAKLSPAEPGPDIPVELTNEPPKAKEWKRKEGVPEVFAWFHFTSPRKAASSTRRAEAASMRLQTMRTQIGPWFRCDRSKAAIEMGALSD
jgi:hypothetical protein